MYEEYKENKINWLILFLRISIILVIILITGYIINMLIIEKDDSYDIFNNNLSILEDTAINYYNVNEIPTTLNESNEISLEKLIENNLIESDIYASYNCDLINSYAKITYIGNDNYTLKVNLNCSNQSDYIINTINIKQ